MKKIGVLRFPGTNCDQDVMQLCSSQNLPAEYLWYQDRFNWKNYSHFIIPGGFSFGDYLRCGALAARSPAMKDLVEAAAQGAPILGICNGFQILCESGLLPGALMKNIENHFIDGWVNLICSSSSKFFAQKSAVGGVTRFPIAHGEGRFVADADELKKIQDHQQIWYKYENNPNGSVNDIAGVMNKTKNVHGLMPHPERALFDWMGGTDGAGFIR
ncbi:MAG: phosphoribosylformylglycinamidine synthase subunit PurQ [Pseudobdellovibrionaceae bacterium]